MSTVVEQATNEHPLGWVSQPVSDAPAPAPRSPLPHETVFARLREVPLSASATSEIVSAQEDIELPVPAKRTDAFTGASKYLTASRANGWVDRATYTRVRFTSAKGAVRYVGTIAIRWQRGPGRVVGYWRTGANGRYVFSFGSARRRDGRVGPFGPIALSAKGVAAALVLPGDAGVEHWRGALTGYQPATAGVDEDAEGSE